MYTCCNRARVEREREHGAPAILLDSTPTKLRLVTGTFYIYSVTQPPLPSRIRPEFKFQLWHRDEQGRNVAVEDSDGFAVPIGPEEEM